MVLNINIHHVYPPMSGQIIEFPVVLLEAATGKVVGECAPSLKNAGESGVSTNGGRPTIERRPTKQKLFDDKIFAKKRNLFMGDG